MTAYIRFLHNGMPIHGGVRSGAHAGWSELLGFSMGGRTDTSRPGMGRLHSRDGGRTWPAGPDLQEMTITKRMDASSSGLMLLSANTYRGSTNVQSGATRPGNGNQAFHGFDSDFVGGIFVPSADVGAEVDFTAGEGNAADLRVRIHGIRIIRFQRTTNGPAPRSANVPAASTTGRGVYLLSTDHIAIAYSRMTHAGAPASAPDISHDVRGRLLVGSDQGVWQRAKTVPQGRLYLGSEVGVF